MVLQNLIKVEVRAHGSKTYWVHKQVALNVATWISSVFAVKVFKWISILLTTGTVSIDESHRNIENALMVQKQISETREHALIEEKQVIETRLSLIQEKTRNKMDELKTALLVQMERSNPEVIDSELLTNIALISFGSIRYTIIQRQVKTFYNAIKACVKEGTNCEVKVLKFFLDVPNGSKLKTKIIGDLKADLKIKVWRKGINLITCDKDGELLPVELQYTEDQFIADFEKIYQERLY